MSSNDNDKSSEVFDLIGNIEERLEKLAFKCFILKYERNKDTTYSEIGFCLEILQDI